MTMQQALATLSERLTDLDEALDHLSWAVVQDQPPADGAPSPAGHLDDMAQAMRGWVAEAKQVIAGRQGSAAFCPLCRPSDARWSSARGFAFKRPGCSTSS